MKNFQTKLQQLKDKNRYRSLSLSQGIDLTSNDYLGLKDHPMLRDAAIAFLQNGGAVGAGGSRLLRGHCEEHATLEAFAAQHFAAPKTLYFASGFQANMAIFQALPARHDTIIFDEFVHASSREGIQNSHAKHIKVAHNDVQQFEEACQKAKGQIWIAVESLYSMDGDLAPLEALYDLACQYDAILIVDEAHSAGIFDPFPVHENVITLQTCGKAIGVAGGLVCSSEAIIDTLINSARGFIYSTAPMPLQAHLVHKALELIASEEGQNRKKMLQHLSQKAQQFFWGPKGQRGTHIIPLILGSDEAAVHAAQQLQDKGYDIRAIRPPTVPEGTARLRLSLSANLDEETLKTFAADFEEIYPLKNSIAV